MRNSQCPMGSEFSVTPRHVIMFQERFAQLVESGAKRQTIRPVRKRPVLPCDVVDLRAWMGKPYRSKQRVLRMARAAQDASQGIIVYHDGVVISPGTLRCFWMGETGPRRDLLEAFARSDGFAGWLEMCEWFDATHGLPFEGVLIKWNL